MKLEWEPADGHPGVFQARTGTRTYIIGEVPGDPARAGSDGSWFMTHAEAGADPSALDTMAQAARNYIRCAFGRTWAESLAQTYEDAVSTMAARRLS